MKFHVDQDLAVGEFGIATRVAQPEDGLPSLPEEAPAKVSIPAPATPVPAPVAPTPPAVVPDTAPATTMIYSREWPEDTEVRTPEPEPEPEREVVTLTLAGRAHEITSRSFVIGRSRECDLSVTDGNASRRHAEIVREGDSYFLVDLGSTNGTELNGKRVTREELSDGDRITLGATDVVFGRSRA